MKYTIIILSIALISISYLMYESESAYAMRTVNNNWDYSGFSFEGTQTDKEANQTLRDSKAVSFVPTFRSYNTISENYEIPNRYTNHNRSDMVY